MADLDAEYEKMREAKKTKREALKRAGSDTKLPKFDLPKAPDELSPPGDSFKFPGGWELAKGKKKGKRRPLEGLA